MPRISVKSVTETPIHTCVPDSTLLKSSSVSVKLLGPPVPPPSGFPKSTVPDSVVTISLSSSELVTSIAAGVPENITEVLVDPITLKQTSNICDPSAKVSPVSSGSNQDIVITPAGVPLAGVPKETALSPSRLKLVTETNCKAAGS